MAWKEMERVWALGCGDLYEHFGIIELLETCRQHVPVLEVMYGVLNCDWNLVIYFCKHICRAMAAISSFCETGSGVFGVFGDFIYSLWCLWWRFS